MSKNLSFHLTICTIFLFFNLKLHAQILMQPQVPSQGIVQQSQLWSLLIINNDDNPFYGRIQVIFQEENTGNRIFTGTSGNLYFPKGLNQINSGNAGAIHYEYSNSGSISGISNGLLPIGRFNICYILQIDYSKRANAPSQECLPITIEPFSPPQLVFPENESVQNTLYPVLNWLPPLPVSMFSNLNYKLIITEVFPGQAPALAIQRNPLLYVQDQIKQTSFVYPSSYVALKPGITYAWQIIAQNGTIYSQATDVWSFTIHKDSILFFLDNAAYPHMQKGAGSSLFGAAEKIKFSYDNESGDSSITVNLLSNQGQSHILLNTIKVSLKRGMNFIDIDLGSVKKLQADQEYLLEFTNSWKENWDLRFRYEPNELK